jgi:glyoxylase-like metal-dependent hydrolase (beta-lactamase superfamily II)
MARAPSKPAVTIATVRMYKGLLGDCFLLRLTADGQVSNILIDCGILQGISGDKALMQKVMADVIATTGGRLDLVVVTHEHHDHVSGFGHAADQFFSDQVKIANLWMAWTEKADDPQAQALNARFNRARQAVALAVERAAALDGQVSPVAGLDNFLGAAPGPGRLTDRVVMEKIKEKTLQDGGTIRFLEPGTVLPAPGGAGFTAHVLGPPRNEARLFQDLPSAGIGKETYLESRFDAAEQLLSAAEGAWMDGEPELPFAPRHGIPEADVQAGSGLAGGWLKAAYYDAPAWRRVDGDWLGVAGPLALKLDSDTNNTSLVLAFAAPGGQVLLFAADAQVGNWLSWHDQTYGPDGIKAADLLARTVFYKVGHHCSHNATLEDKGLELMAGTGLTAMIPVVETDARRQGTKGWNMPFPPLLARLLEKTDGRVLRGDAPADLTGFAKDRVREAADGLWVEYDAVV